MPPPLTRVAPPSGRRLRRRPCPPPLPNHPAPRTTRHRSRARLRHRHPPLTGRIMPPPVVTRRVYRGERSPHGAATRQKPTGHPHRLPTPRAIHTPRVPDRSGAGAENSDGTIDPGISLTVRTPRRKGLDALARVSRTASGVVGISPTARISAKTRDRTTARARKTGNERQHDSTESRGVWTIPPAGQSLNTTPTDRQSRRVAACGSASTPPTPDDHGRSRSRSRLPDMCRHAACGP